MSDDIKPTKPLLDANDLQTAVWRKVREHLEATLAKARARNDDKSHDEIETAYLRGRIALAKHLLALGNTSPAPDAHEDETE